MSCHVNPLYILLHYIHKPKCVLLRCKLVNTDLCKLWIEWVWSTFFYTFICNWRNINVETCLYGLQNRVMSVAPQQHSGVVLHVVCMFCVCISVYACVCVHWLLSCLWFMDDLSRVYTLPFVQRPLEMGTNRLWSFLTVSQINVLLIWPLNLKIKVMNIVYLLDNLHWQHWNSFYGIKVDSKYKSMLNV